MQLKKDIMQILVNRRYSFDSFYRDHFIMIILMKAYRPEGIEFFFTSLIYVPNTSILKKDLASLLPSLLSFPPSGYVECI